MHNYNLFKQSSSEWTPTKQVKRERCQRQAKNSSKLSVCRVCGGQASIFNYGALSCQSCKTFFRRNGYHPEVRT